MNLIDAKATALGLMWQNGLGDWRVTWKNSRRTFGACIHSKRLISLSRPLFLLNDEEECRNTILHEIVHVLCPKSEGHGMIWKIKALKLGARPERCYKKGRVVTPPAPFVGSCSCGRVHVERFKRFVNYVCRFCHEAVTWKRN